MSGVRVALVLVIMLLFVKSTEAVDERIRIPDIEVAKGNITAMFLETDKDQNGKITKSEFRSFLLNRLDVSLEADMVAEVLGHYDKDGDGYLNFEEFKDHDLQLGYV